MEKLKKYGYNPGFQISNLQPQVAGEALEKIAEKYGKIETDIVVDEAKDKKHPLHNYFEWNDKKAAGLYRNEQAGLLIRAICVEIMPYDNEGSSITIQRAFVNVKQHDFKGYHPIEKVLNDSTLTEMMLEQAKKELISFTERYKHLAQLKGLIDAMNNYLITA